MKVCLSHAVCVVCLVLYPSLSDGSTSYDLFLTLRQDARGWSCSPDMNRDGLFTVSDIRLLTSCIFYYPGDALIYSRLERPGQFATFFELSSEAYGGRLSLFVSLAAWGIVALGVLGIWAVSFGSYYAFKDQARKRRIQRKGAKCG